MKSRMQFEDFLKTNFLESSSVQDKKKELHISEDAINVSLNKPEVKKRLIDLKSVLEMHLPEHEDHFDHDHVNAVKWSKAANANRELEFANSKKHNDFSVFNECKKAFVSSKIGDTLLHEFDFFFKSVKDLSVKKLCPVKTALGFIFVTSFMIFVFVLSPINIDGSISKDRIGLFEAFGMAKITEAKEDVREVRVTRDMISDYVREGKGEEMKRIVEGKVAGVNEELIEEAGMLEGIKDFFVQQKNNFKKKLK